MQQSFPARSELLLLDLLLHARPALLGAPAGPALHRLCPGSLLHGQGRHARARQERDAVVAFPLLLLRRDAAGRCRLGRGGGGGGGCAPPAHLVARRGVLRFFGPEDGPSLGPLVAPLKDEEVVHPAERPLGGAVLVPLPHLAQLVEPLLEEGTVQNLIVPLGCVPSDDGGFLQELVDHLGEWKSCTARGASQRSAWRGPAGASGIGARGELQVVTLDRRGRLG
mmetsp:Transcript_42006/g.102522  ORF Transcript_42006/g.102522 Transcript_42006/m.102522 type:complete len:224 (-) Transcript_42006:602-1273(-)